MRMTLESTLDFINDTEINEHKKAKAVSRYYETLMNDYYEEANENGYYIDEDFKFTAIETIKYELLNKYIIDNVINTLINTKYFIEIQGMTLKEYVRDSFDDQYVTLEEEFNSYLIDELKRTFDIDVDYYEMLDELLGINENTDIEELLELLVHDEITYSSFFKALEELKLKEQYEKEGLL